MCISSMLRRILIPIGYFLVVAAVVLITVGLVAYGQGIEYDFKTGRIIHTGLVIIQSSPSSVAVSLNGKTTKKKTSYRASFEAGDYTFELAKDGYYTWKKTLKVVSSEVTLAQYVLMVPRHPNTTTLDTKAQIVAQSISKDHRHVAYATGGPEAAVYTLDLGNPKPVKIYSAKVATPEQPAETLLDVTWNDDASKLLVASQNGPTATHHLMNADGASAINLTQQYGFNFTGLKFNPANGQQLYWVSPDGLRRLDVGAQSVSAVLADKVTGFQMAPDRVLYVQTTELGHSLWSLDGRGHKQELIQALPESDTYAMAFTTYRGTEELAIVPSKTRVGTLYSDIYGTNPVAKTIARDVSEAAFAADGHLLTFSSATNLVTYDLELSTLTGKLVTYHASGIHDLAAVTWFDNFHLLANEGGHLMLMEYDGANGTDLGALTGTFPAYATADARSIVALRPVGSGVGYTQITIKP